MLSGYFIESGGAVTPAIESFLRQEVKDEKERITRTRRGAKTVAYGSYNMKELMDKLQAIVEEEREWQATVAQGYRVVSVDITAFMRAAVKELAAKTYDSDADKAVLAAGFGLVEAVEANIMQSLIRLSKNVTFGKTAGQIPERTSAKGIEPTQYKAEIVRPLARTHGDKTLAATAADEICTMRGEDGREIMVHIWHKLYFLERQLKKVTDTHKKHKLRHIPLKVMAIYDPDYDDPLLLGTPLLELEPESASKVYIARWPIE